MFLDASALVAILSEEQGSETLIDRLERATEPPITSLLAIYETVTAPRRKKTSRSTWPRRTSDPS